MIGGSIFASPGVFTAVPSVVAGFLLSDTSTPGKSELATRRFDKTQARTLSSEKFPLVVLHVTFVE